MTVGNDVGCLATKKSSPSSLSPWKTFVIGGILGYLLAMMAIAMHDDRYSLYSLVGMRQLDQIVVGQEDEVEEEEDYDVTRMSITVMCIILLLIGMTIAFEFMKEYLEESVDRSIRPIVASLFGELTVLGFLSIFTFLVTKLGLMDNLSIAIFGEHEEEENILLETFEEVHYMLFFIMASFVFSVILLVKDAKRMENKWWSMNMVCMKSNPFDDECILEQIRGEMIQKTNKHAASSSSWISYLCHQLLFLFKKNRMSKYNNKYDNISVEAMYLFSELRKEFILERCLHDPPFEPNLNPGHLSDDFNFARYLNLCLGNTLGHAVHLNYHTWAFFAFFTIIYFGILMLTGTSHTEESFPWIWVGSAWLCLLISNHFDHHILQILHNMVPELPKATTSGSTTNGDDKFCNNLDESNTLLPSSSPSLLPAWTKIQLSEKGEAKHKARQDALYWTGRNGPNLYLIIFQIQLIFISTYISLLLVKVYPDMISSSLWSIRSIIFYIIASLVPLLLLWEKFPRVASQLTIVCNIGVHRRPQKISEVIRMDKTDSLIQSMVIIQQLENIAQKGRFTNSTEKRMIRPRNLRQSMLTRERSVGNDQLVGISKIFDNFDKSGDGCIDASELQNIFENLGMTTTSESMNTMMRLLDWDADGSISKNEFILFYSEYIIAATSDDIDIDSISKELFAQFDLDNSGTITLSEFVKVMEGLNVGFTMDEISELINEMDGLENGYDGTISEKGFRTLLETHRHLFDHQMTRRTK